VLRDLVVLVTGSSSGIGRALAVEFSRRGHQTFASARRPGTLEKLEGPTLTPLALDVANSASIDAAVAAVIERAGRIDVLVNNAGINRFGPLPEVPLAEVRRLVETNLVGPLALVQAVFPHMARRRRGRIVNVGSVVGVLPTPFAGAYCASKAGLHALSDVLRMELAAFGIDVILVQPGAVRSNIAASGAVGIERYSREPSRYRAVAREIEQRAYVSQRAPMEADEFARRLVDRVTRRRPPRLIRLGQKARLLPALAWLPGALRDRLMARRFGLNRPGLGERGQA
jgi:NAD(P)-dependent dehydrogenase (short-subunit alcohol dehydrogenase family)